MDGNCNLNNRHRHTWLFNQGHMRVYLNWRRNKSQIVQLKQKAEKSENMNLLHTICSDNFIIKLKDPFNVFLWSHL